MDNEKMNLGIQKMIDSIGDSMADAIFERMNDTLQKKMLGKVEPAGDEKLVEVDEPVALGETGVVMKNSAEQTEQTEQAEQAEQVEQAEQAEKVAVEAEDSDMMKVLKGKYMMFAGYVSKHRTFATFLFDEQNKTIKILKNSEIPVDCNVKNLDGCGVVQYIKIRDISTLTVCSRYKCVASQDRYDLCKLIIENGGIPGIKDSTAKNGVRVNTDAAPVYRLNQDSEWIDYLYALQILYGDNAMSYANWYNVFTCETVGAYLTRKDMRISKENGRGGEIVELKTKEGEGLEYKLQNCGGVTDGNQYVPDQMFKEFFKEEGISDHIPAPRRKPRKKAAKTA